MQTLDAIGPRPYKAEGTESGKEQRELSTFPLLSIPLPLTHA